MTYQHDNPIMRKVVGLAGAAGRVVGPAFCWGEAANAETAPGGQGIEALEAALQAADVRLQRALAGADATAGSAAGSAAADAGRSRSFAMWCWPASVPARLRVRR